MGRSSQHICVMELLQLCASPDILHVWSLVNSLLENEDVLPFWKLKHTPGRCVPPLAQPGISGW